MSADERPHVLTFRFVSERPASDMIRDWPFISRAPSRGTSPARVHHGREHPTRSGGKQATILLDSSRTDHRNSTADRPERSESPAPLPGAVCSWILPRTRVRKIGHPGEPEAEAARGGAPPVSAERSVAKLVPKKASLPVERLSLRAWATPHSSWRTAAKTGTAPNGTASCAPEGRFHPKWGNRPACGLTEGRSMGQDP